MPEFFISRVLTHVSAITIEAGSLAEAQQRLDDGEFDDALEAAVADYMEPCGHEGSVREAN